MKSYVIYLSVILCLVIATLFWIADARLDDFKAYHLAIAQESTSSSANEIARFVKEKKRLVSIFAKERAAEIDLLGGDAEDETQYLELREHIALYFPDFFSFTVTDAGGEPYMPDFDGFIGDLCRTDLGDFARSGAQRPRVHPHSDVYHFDILAPFTGNQRQGILFISFKADILGDTLRASQTPGHQLMLVHPEASDLIEVTSRGARVQLVRDDFRLAVDERNRILYRARVPGTSWDIVDLREPTLISDYQHKLLIHSCIILLLFCLISLFMLFLVRREERLRKAAEAHKDEFLAVISHELRTPLTSIRGSIGLIEGGKTGETNEQTRILAHIATRNCERLSALVDDLLDLRKIESGQFTLNKAPVDLHTLVRKSINANQGYAEEFNVEFRMDEPSGDIRVTVDENRIMQVMANLLSNAAKYGKTGDVIEVNISSTGHFARVSVTDHGDGIPESFREMVFQRFAQHDASSVRKVGGSGLGLSIVKHIVELHDGIVGLRTETGLGSTFYFDLPAEPQSL